MLQRKILKRHDIDIKEYYEVERIGNELFEYISLPEVMEKMNLANIPGNSSSVVQNVFLEKALDLGFQSEKKKLFNKIPTKNLRPDYYINSKGAGIIIEVERGKTIMNNMDMLDIWKCHLCESANHLFLFVPNNLKHNSASKPYNCFEIVSNRMEPFFKEGNYINIHSLWIFGY